MAVAAEFNQEATNMPKLPTREVGYAKADTSIAYRKDYSGKGAGCQTPQGT